MFENVTTKPIILHADKTWRTKIKKENLTYYGDIKFGELFFFSHSVNC